MNAQSIIPPNIDYGKISADKYSPDETYEAGELRIQYNSLWKAKQAISVPEPWTPDHWDPTTLAAEFSALNSRGPGIIDTFFVNANTVTDRTLPSNGAFLLVINNTYNVGGIWYISTGGSSSAARIAPIVPSSISSEAAYFTISSDSYNTIKISAGGATADAYVYRLDRILPI